MVEKPRDAFAVEFSPNAELVESGFEDFEDDLLDESQEQYRSVSPPCLKPGTNG